MDIVQVYRKFPSKEDCLKHLVSIRWKAGVFCPYCRSNRVSTARKFAIRFHCNHCNTSFSATVKTPFHNTKLDLQKWFLAVFILQNSRMIPTSRKLGMELEVTKDTALLMTHRIRRALAEQDPFMVNFLGNPLN